MARRKREEEHDNHERWLVSYADFITLLFAFFVVMYALSTVNEGKYRILSDSMVAAFRNIQVNTPTPVAVVLPPPLPALQRPAVQLPPRPAEAGKQDAVRQKQRDTMRSVAKDILEVMAPLIEQGKVRVIETSRGVTIEITGNIETPSAQFRMSRLPGKSSRAIA